jgi:hypothetical protein
MADPIYKFGPNIWPGSPDGSGGGGDDMLTRIKKLEDDFQVIKTDIAIIKSNYSTKTDVSQLSSDMHSILRQQTWSIIGALITVIAIAASVIIKYT